MNFVCKCGKCEEVLKEYPDNYFDSIVTDPPYGLSFMGKKWDYDVPSVDQWKEILRVLKPGGHLLSFSGTRTYHRMVVNIEDAGFEIRDMISWVYGSGFPKSLDVGKAVDLFQGNEREEIGPNPSYRKLQNDPSAYNLQRNPVMTKGNSEWEGFGTALKPAFEPIVLARKPLSEKNVAENVLKWGTGGLNIDGCRIPIDKIADASQLRTMNRSQRINDTSGQVWGTNKKGSDIPTVVSDKGRFPANFIHDGSDEVMSLFPNVKSGASGKGCSTKMGGMFGNGKEVTSPFMPASSGSAARFFYCAKASKSERNLGLEHFAPKKKIFNGQSDTSSTDMKDVEKRFTTQPSPNNHATVKPIALMRYLCRLLTPPNGTVLDPFMGSGSTGIGVVLEGFNFVGIEMDEYFCEVSEARIGYWKNHPPEDSEIVKKKEVKQEEWW